MPFHGRQLAALLAITVLAGLLRLTQLGEWSIWVDEAHTWRDVTMPMERFEDEVRWWYPTSFLLLRWLLDSGVLPGFSEGWLRLPFAFFGIVSVPLLAFLGNLIVGRRPALLAALFLAINPWHIYWSQNARGYSLLLLCAVVAAGTFWLGMLRRSRTWIAVALVATALAGTCHFTGFVLLPVFAAHLLFARHDMRGRRLWVALGVFGVVLAVLPHLMQLLPPARAFLGAKPTPSLVHLVQTSAFYFRPPLICVAVVGVWLLFQRRLHGRALYLACWALVPLALLAFVGSTMVMVTARYALSSLPAVLLLAGAASVRLGEALAQAFRERGRWLARVPAMVLPVLLCVDMLAYDYHYFTSQYGDRGRWREACQLVLAESADKPVTVCTTNEPTLLYYLRPNHHRSPASATENLGRTVYGLERGWVFGEGRPEHAGWGGRSYFRAMAALARKEGGALFVVASLPELQQKDQDGSILAALREDFELRTVLPCWVGPKDESVYVWRRRDGR